MLGHARTYGLQGLGGLHGHGIHPTLEPGAWRNLDHVRGVHPDVKAQHERHRGRFEFLFLSPFRHDALPLVPPIQIIARTVSFLYGVSSGS